MSEKIGIWVLSIFIIIGCFLFGKYYYTKTSPTVENYDVDLVYLWVDGNDPKFQKLKDSYKELQEEKFSTQSSGSGRYEQVDELKYSLRSVERYLPWIHHVYIVTSRQTPEWINLDNPKITIIDDSELIPAEYEPVFNSNAIESVIYKIPNLTEHFLYSCDDMFVNRPLKKSFFFNNGKIIIRLFQQKVSNNNRLYVLQLRHALDLIKRDFGYVSMFSTLIFRPHHNIDAYLKSDYEACAKHFEKEYTETLTHRFRKETSVQRFIVSIYSYIKDHAEIKIVERELKEYRPEKTDSLYISNTQRNLFGLLIHYNPALFCINDTEFSTTEDRMYVKSFLKKRFPIKSSYEK